MKVGIRVALTSLLLASVASGQSPPSTILTQPTDRFIERREAKEPEESERDEIETDRDSFTPSVRTTPRGRLITESAYTSSDFRKRPDTHSFPELLFRYGATERLELRLGWNYEIGGVADMLAGESRSERESNLNIGTKLQITKQNRWIPASALILTALVPTSGAETNTLFVGTFAFGWELPKRWKLDAAIRYGTAVEERDHFSEWAPSVVLKVPLGEKWSIHAEYFGIFTSGKEHDEVLHYFTPGVHYLVTPDLEVGTRVGWGLNDQSARFFVNVGMGYRY